MFDKVNNEIKESMKSGQKEKLEVLRMFKAKLIENKTSAKPKAEVDVAVAHYKQLKDSIEAYPEGAPQRDAVLKELVYLAPYLPTQLDENSVRTIVKTILEQLKASGKPNMGMIMKELSPKIKGQFDGKRANEIVNEELGKLTT